MRLVLRHNLVEDGNGTPYQTRVSALGDNGEHVVVAVLQDRADLLRGAGFRNQLPLAAVLAHPIPIERFHIIRCCVT